MRVEKPRSRALPARTLAACIACALLAGEHAVAEIEYGVGAGVGYSDNILRSDRNEIEETIGIATADLTWLERTRRLDADVTVNLSYFEYLDDTVESEVFGRADGLVVVGLVPERFTWLFQDSFGQVQSDPFLPSTPETRENLNYFTTGPDITLRFGTSTFSRIYGRYSSVDYEESLLDAERLGAGLVIGRRLASGELALNGVAEEVTFDELPDQDFERRHVYLSHSLQGSRTTLSTELGYTWLEMETRETGGALANVSISRQVSSSSTVVLSLGTRFTDASEAMRSGSVQVGTGGDITATADPFENRSAELSWRYARNRTTFGLGVSWHDDSYEQQSMFDRTRLAYDLNFTRGLTPTLQAGFRALYTEEEFETTTYEADELLLALDLTWRIARTVSLSLTLDHTSRSAMGDLGEFDENRAYLMVTYRPRGGSAELMRP